MTRVDCFTPRTDEEIIARIEEIKDEDFFGIEVSDLMLYLPYEKARPLMSERARNDDAIKADWKQHPRDDISLRQAMEDYLTFAWDKANSCRGLSAMRSMDHMSAWLWMLGFSSERSDSVKRYTHYGKPQLREISEMLKVDWRSMDNGKWTSDEMKPGVAADDVPRVNLWNNDDKEEDHT